MHGTASDEKVAQRAGGLAVARDDDRYTVHEMQVDAGLLAQRQHIGVEWRGIACGDRDVIGACLASGKQMAHPAYRF
ncbi:MAG: hypothetical protein RR983_10575 [Massilia sp.]|uniref:hypothetical protein n=1 Tax=Massilia sp. TaxID=1882437 RepID=UPI002FC83EF9